MLIAKRKQDEWARSLHRGNKEGVKISQNKKKVQTATNQWWTAYSPKSGQTYNVTVYVGESGAHFQMCSCPAYEFYRYCKHVALVVDRLSDLGFDIALS